MAGLEVTGTNIQNRCGTVAAQVFAAFAEVRKIKAYLDQYTSADLEAKTPTGSIPSGDGAKLKSAYADLDQMADIFEGSANLTLAKDFRTFAKQLYGIGQY